MRLFIARHGQTFENVNHIIQGWTFGTLTDEGLHQAVKLAVRLQSETFSAIYSSDLDRARKTSEEIGKFHDVEIQFSTALRERCFGVFEGKSVEASGYRGSINFGVSSLRNEKKLLGTDVLVAR